MIILKEDLGFDFNYLLEQFECPNYNKYKNQDMLYHNTKIQYVDDIANNGLRLDRSKQLEYQGNTIWCVDVPGATGYGGCTIAFRNDFANGEAEKVNDTDVLVYKNIPPKDILFIDTWISDDVGLKRVSDMKRLIDRQGVDKISNILHKKESQGVKFFYDIDYLLGIVQKS